VKPAESTAAIRAWWEQRPSGSLPLGLRSRFATLLIRCERLERLVNAVNDYDTEASWFPAFMETWCRDRDALLEVEG
jgi:hypothetical protein